MATMREHLAGLHKNFAEHFRKKASHHEEMHKSHTAHAALHDTLYKSTAMQVHKDFAAQHRADAKTHEGMAEHYSAQGDHHADQAEKCMKAADGDLNKLVPTGVSGVTPTRVVAVPRAGQRPLPTSADKPDVPIEFQKLFTVEDEEARIG
jgi:hypothetical protein